MNDNGNYWTRVASRRLSRRKIFGLAGSGAVAAYLSACGGGSSSPSTKTAQSGGTPASGATQAATKIKTGGTLTVAQTLNPSTLDPTIVVSGGDDVFARPFFDYLLARTTTGTKQDFDPTHSLATSYELADPTTLVLHLREGVQFHDGNPFTSADVAWNIQHTQDPALSSVNAQTYAVIDRVETPDAQTAKFILKSPNADMIVNLGGRGGQVLSPKAVDKYGKQFGVNPVGTGPFIFEEFVSGSHVTAKKNPNYWRKDADGTPHPYIDTLIQKAIPDSTTRLAALATGDLDITGFDPKDLSIAKGNSKVNVQILKGIGTASTIVSNPDVKPADNVNLRRALVWALDPSAVNKAVYFDLGVPADGGVSPTAVWAHSAVPGRPSYDPKKAKQYLDAAGYPNGVSIDVLTYSAPLIVQQTQIYQQQWKAIGINANVKTEDVGASTKDFFQAHSFPTFSTSWGAGDAPDGLVRGIVGDGAFYNPSKQKNPAIETLLDKAVATYDQTERKAIYEQADAIYLDQAFWVPMLYSTGLVAMSKQVQNQAAMFYGFYIQHFEDLWISS